MADLKYKYTRTLNVVNRTDQMIHVCKCVHVFNILQ